MREEKRIVVKAVMVGKPDRWWWARGRGCWLCGAWCYCGMCCRLHVFPSILSLLHFTHPNQQPLLLTIFTTDIGTYSYSTNISSLQLIHLFRPVLHNWTHRIQVTMEAVAGGISGLFYRFVSLGSGRGSRASEVSERCHRQGLPPLSMILLLILLLTPICRHIPKQCDQRNRNFTWGVLDTTLSRTR